MCLHSKIKDPLTGRKDVSSVSYSELMRGHCCQVPVLVLVVVWQLCTSSSSEPVLWTTCCMIIWKYMQRHYLLLFCIKMEDTWLFVHFIVHSDGLGFQGILSSYIYLYIYVHHSHVLLELGSRYLKPSKLDLHFPFKACVLLGWVAPTQSCWGLLQSETERNAIPARWAKITASMQQWAQHFQVTQK